MTELSTPRQWEYFDTLPAGIVILQPDYTVVYWNRTITEWTDILPREILGRDIRDLFPNLDSQRYSLRIQQVLNGGPAAFFSTQFHPHFLKAPLPRGGLRFQRTSIHAISENGQNFALIVIDDVTALVSQVHAFREMKDMALAEVEERKRKDAALEESETKFRQIFDSANDAIHLQEIRDDGTPGKFIDVNAIAGRMLGYRKEELLAMGPLDLVTEYYSRPLTQIGDEIKNSGQAVFETEHRRKDGSIVPVEVHAHVVVIQDRKMVLSVVRDITRRKQDEQAHLRLSTDLKTIFDNTPTMIWYKDTRNGIIRVNPAAARSVGVSIDEIEGKSAYDLFPDMADAYYKDDQEVIRTGLPKLGITEQQRTAQGSLLWVHTDKIPLRDEQGQVTGILVLVTDITERKMAEDALILAGKKINLLGSISRHDILNQIMVILGYVALARADAVDPSMEETLREIESATKTIRSQIEFTRVYQDLGSHEPQWQEIEEIIPRADVPRGIRLDTDLSGVFVYADPMLPKVFFNLLDNSVKHGDRVTCITISQEPRGDGMVIVWEDNGAGVVTSEKTRIFERGVGKNTGLGLFLIREILSITGITITETGEPGKGARFEMLVPEGGAYRCDHLPK